MRNRILKGSFLVALGYLPVLGCGGGDDGKSNGVGKGGSGGSAASSGTGNGGASAGTIPIGGTSSGASNTGGSSAGTLGEDGACVSDSRNGSRATVALYFMVDISGSMNCHIPEETPACTSDPNDDMPYPTTRWTQAAPALQSFFTGPGTDGMWAGINFFSKNGSCNANDYADPNVEIGLLTDNAQDISDAIEMQTPAGATPTVPSITAAIDHARDWANDHADQQVIVVYMTDGYPLGCSGGSNTIANAATVAADGFSGTPSIRTFVLGIGPNLTDLNQIAMSGGTNQALFIDTSGDVGQQLITRLNEIRQSVVVDCAYTIPPAPPGQTFAPGMVNISITGSSGDETGVYPADAACTEGWKYNDANTQIILCGSTCDAIQSDPGARLNVHFGCQTRQEPP